MLNNDQIQQLSANLLSVQSRIAAASQRGKRDRQSIQVIAVSKYVNAECIQALHRLGVSHFGENRVQDLLEKQLQLAANPDQRQIHWHLIGTLQKNKIRKALQHAEQIHSADSLDLLENLNRIAGELKTKARVFLQVNISGESSKHGFCAQEVLPVLQEARRFPELSISGLMTMAPHSGNPEDSRPVFRSLRLLRDEAAGKNLFSGTGELSMGMTQDFEIAVEEGANWLRIGSALFQGIDLKSQT